MKLAIVSLITNKGGSRFVNYQTPWLLAVGETAFFRDPDTQVYFIVNVVVVVGFVVVVVVVVIVVIVVVVVVDIIVAGAVIQ